MTTFQQYGIVPCAYRVPAYEEGNIQITQRGPDAWVIERYGTCLNNLGEWEFEPQPSSRTDEFKARTRYTLQEAMQKAVDHFKLGFVE